MQSPQSSPQSSPEALARASRLAIVIPGAPLLVDQLVGSPGDPVADIVRAAAQRAGQWLGERADTWHVWGDGSGAPIPVLGGAGTFDGFGADVVVSPASNIPASNIADGVAAGCADQAPSPAKDWPLPLLIASWLRESSAPAARIVGADEPAAGAVFVLDGPNTLTLRAPGGYRPDDQAVFDAQVAAVCQSGSTADLDLGPDWIAAADVIREGGVVTTLYSGAPFGVGYLVAIGGSV